MPCILTSYYEPAKMNEFVAQMGLYIHIHLLTEHPAPPTSTYICGTCSIIYIRYGQNHGL